MVDALVPNDPRVEHKFAEVGGFKYHYMLARPEGKPTATVFLIHGWYVVMLYSHRELFLQKKLTGYSQARSRHGMALPSPLLFVSEHASRGAR